MNLGAAALEFRKRRRFTRARKQAEDDIDPTLMDLRERHVAKWRQVIARYFDRQGRAMVPRVREGASIEAVWSDGERWDNELTADIYRLNTATATVWAKSVAEALEHDLDTDVMAEYLQQSAHYSALNINQATQEQVATALRAEVAKEAVRQVFETAQEGRAGQIAQSRVTAMSNFGSVEGAKQGGLRYKVWHHNPALEPRPEHAAMNGVRVGINERFPNGLLWPGDPAGGAEENSHCHCSVTFPRETLEV